MHQSSALRTLEIVLDEAVSSNGGNQTSAIVLLSVMKLPHEPQHVVDIYELLNRAREEATTLKNQPKLPRYLKTLEGLRHFFIVNHIWTTLWVNSASHIESTGVLTTLDALANYFHDQNPTVLLEQDFLEKLSEEFSQLLSKILKSDLSREFKKLLTDGVEDILNAIRRYRIDGTEGLKKAAQSLVSDLVMTEHFLKDEDKKDPVYKHTISWILMFLRLIMPTSAYDVIGAVPDVESFWLPRIEELVMGQEKIEQSISETSTIQEAVERASKAFNGQTQKSITGSKEQQALPPAKTFDEQTQKSITGSREQQALPPASDENP
jgi:hypothetical protein